MQGEGTTGEGVEHVRVVARCERDASVVANDASVQVAAPTASSTAIPAAPTTPALTRSAASRPPSSTADPMRRAAKITPDAACLAFCMPLTPNGCDCFGCCEVFAAAGSSRFVFIRGETGIGEGT